MFAKLLKYEFRNSRDTIGLMSLIILAVAAVAAISTKIMIVDTSKLSSSLDDFSIAVILFLVLAVIALIAYMVVSMFLLLAQFYKNKFTDEGYLTFTLPANVHQIYLASLLNMVIWSLIVFIVAMAAIAIYVLFGTDADHLINTSIFQIDYSEEFWVLGSMLESLHWTAVDTIRLCIQAVISALSSLVLCTTCITIGATVAKKHKVLAAVGFYFLAGYMTSTITTNVTVSNTVEALYGYGTVTVMDSFSSIGTLQTIVNLVILVGGYFLTTYFMKKKLNLP